MILEYLKWYDVLILTVIMFGPAIILSFSAVTAESHEEGLPKENLKESEEFSSKENWWALGTQVIQLCIAIGYLFLRNFNFSRWNFDIGLKEIGLSILLFFLCGLIMDFLMSLNIGFDWIPKTIKSSIPIVDAFQQANVSTAVYSFFNGFYEELFFLGIALAIEPKFLVVGFIYSLVVRILFHTYQGLWTAVTMGLDLGLVYFLLYANVNDNLLIFAIAHGIADLLGLSFVNIL